MSALSDELNNDPANVGYAPLIAAENIRGLATLAAQTDTNLADAIRNA